MKIPIYPVLFFFLRSMIGTSGGTCESPYATNPEPQWASTGWISHDVGSQGRRQGHVTGVIHSSNRDFLVTWGGTDIRNDDVNNVLGTEASVSLLDISTPGQNWTTLTMIAYNGAPAALFRAGSFLWKNSIFIVGGHTDEPFTVTSEVWRADILAYEEAPEALWRQVKADVGDKNIAQDVIPPGRYGHTATVMETEEADPEQVWVAVIGGMAGNQEGVDENYILKIADTGDAFACDDADLPPSSTLSCSHRTHTRPRDSEGEWWSLDARLSPTSPRGPAQRSYHVAASIPSDGNGNSSCVFVFSGMDYAKSVLFDDLWRLCPVAGSLGNSADTAFVWTELFPLGGSVKGRYGATLTPVWGGDGYRILLYGGTGRYPNLYMDDEFTVEYDAYMNAWVDGALSQVGDLTPGGRRDHTLEAVQGRLYLIAGIDNGNEVLKDLWSINYSSPSCAGGEYMFFCEETAVPVCGKCPNGTVAPRSSYACTSCSSGTFVGDGASECVPCPPGTYGMGDGRMTEATACHVCPAGTMSPAEGTPSVSDCVDCPAGTFSFDGASECSPCPSGFYSLEGASTCLPCPVGTFRAPSSASTGCEACPAGTYAPFTQSGACLDCPKGFYSVADGASECIPCPQGTAGGQLAGGDLAEACTVCKEGSFSRELGSSSCEFCPPGTASSTKGASTAQACEACPPGSFAKSGSAYCEPCTAGSYTATIGAESCEACPVGTYVNTTGSRDVNDCSQCPQGSTTNSTGAKSSLHCVPCPPGTRSVHLEDGGGCKVCSRGEYTSTYAEAQAFNCTQCAGGSYADTVGSASCSPCDEDRVSFNAHASCSACSTNETCPVGPNGEYCSGFGDCFLGICACSAGFHGVDCSNGTCDGCGGVFGFAFESTKKEVLESDGEVVLTLTRLAGTDGNATVAVDVIDGNVTRGADYGGAWPMEVNFSSGQREATLVVPVTRDEEPDEDCEVLVLGVVNVTGVNASVVVEAGINNVSSEAFVAIREVNFTGAVLEMTFPQDALSGPGGLSPASAKIVVSKAEAPWASNVTLRAVGTTPANLSQSPPLNVLLLVEINAHTSGALQRLAKLLPGLAAEAFENDIGLTVPVGHSIASLHDDRHRAFTSATQDPQPPRVPALQIQPRSPSLALGVAAYASGYYEVVQPLTTNIYHAAKAMEDVASSSRSLHAGPPGSPWRALYDAASEDGPGGNNATGWKNETFRVVAAVTGSSLTTSPGFDPLDPSSSWMMPDGISLRALASQLSISMVHPAFLLLNETAHVEYQALVQALGFGAATVVDEEAALAHNYYDFYIPRAFVDALEVLYTQATLFVTADEGGFVTSIAPTPDASRNVTAGHEVHFDVNLSATNASTTGEGTVTLNFQGYTAVLTVVRERETCNLVPVSRSSGAADAAASDSERAGWVQQFYFDRSDEDTKWVLGSTFSLTRVNTGPFGIPTGALGVSCPMGCSDEEASIGLTLAYGSEIPLVLKAYFFPPAAPAEVAVASVTLDVTYKNGSIDGGVAVLDFAHAPTGAWKQSIIALYPERHVTNAQVTLSFSGTGEAWFAGVGLFAHPDAPCHCDAGYYLDVSSAPGRLCSPQSGWCTSFEGNCVYCPAGYKCPQGDVLTICSGGTYSMGGSTECHQCPSGWICENGLAAPCGHGTSMTPITTNTKMKGVGDSPASSVVDASSGEACVSCSPGGQCPGGGVWEACPPGTFSPGGDASNVCQPCPPGNFTNHSATVECYSCHAGFTSNFGATECRECPPGTHSEAGQHPCEPCATGTFAEGGWKECKPCPFGHYASEQAMYACEPCPNARNTTSTGSSSVHKCI